MAKCNLNIRKLAKPLGNYKYELFGGISGGQHHSGLFKTKGQAEKMKKMWNSSCKKNPKSIQWRKR